MLETLAEDSVAYRNHDDSCAYEDSPCDTQKHPEKYENLQVRVAGWNIRWNDIPRKEQDEYIARIETVEGGL